MTGDQSRLESRLADVRQALGEARSPDVRAFLQELLDTYEAQLADGDGAASDGARDGSAAADAG